MAGHQGTGDCTFGCRSQASLGTNSGPEQCFAPDTSRAQLVHESIVPYGVRLSSGHDNEG